MIVASKGPLSPEDLEKNLRKAFVRAIKKQTKPFVKTFVSKKAKKYNKSKS